MSSLTSETDILTPNRTVRRYSHVLSEYAGGHLESAILTTAKKKKTAQVRNVYRTFSESAAPKPPNTLILVICIHGMCNIARNDYLL